MSMTLLEQTFCFLKADKVLTFDINMRILSSLS
jgi:hypothetical protein